jgi:hypothetical protein
VVSRTTKYYRPLCKMAHPPHFDFKHFEYSSDGYKDYYGVVLRQPLAGFTAGTHFPAVSVRQDGAIHGSQGARVFYLGNEAKMAGAHDQTSAKVAKRNRKNENSARLALTSPQRPSPRTSYGSFDLLSLQSPRSLGLTGGNRSPVSPRGSMNACGCGSRR